MSILSRNTATEALSADHIFARPTLSAICRAAICAVRTYRHKSAQRRQTRQAIAEMRFLSDRALNDIGVHRAEILAAAFGPVAERAVRCHPVR